MSQRPSPSNFENHDAAAPDRDPPEDEGNGATD
jgi:hypothetical protein